MPNTETSIPAMISVGGVLIRRLNPSIGNVIVGGGLAYLAGESYRSAGVGGIDMMGTHVHHDVLSVGLLGVVATLHYLGYLPEEAAAFMYGFGAGGIVHHFVTEPEPSEGISIPIIIGGE